MPAPMSPPKATTSGATQMAISDHLVHSQVASPASHSGPPEARPRKATMSPVMMVSAGTVNPPVSYTHLTLPTNREV